jgi:hypothetical protein
MIEIKIIFASAMHLRSAHDNCFVEVDTTDGQHFQTSINPDRYVMLPPKEDVTTPTTVAFNESFRILIPQVRSK